MHERGGFWWPNYAGEAATSETDEKNEEDEDKEENMNMVFPRGNVKKAISADCQPE